MLARKRKSAGFTLIEILIVVVILGILAAIVIPQFTTASDAARASSLTSQLQTVRSQLELYNVQHNGTYPTLVQMQADDPNAVVAGQGWSVLLTETDAAGAILAGNPFGPYLQKPPTNSFTGSTTVGALGASTNANGWAYDETTGEIRGVVQNTFTLLELGLDATDVELVAP